MKNSSPVKVPYPLQCAKILFFSLLILLDILFSSYLEHPRFEFMFKPLHPLFLLIWTVF